MTDKQINKWLRRQFTVLGWMLIGYYVLMNILASLGMALDSLKQALPALAMGRFPEIDLDAAMNNAWGYIAAVAVFLVVLHGWKGTDFWKEEILVREKKMSGKVFFCLLSLCIGSQMINTLWISLLELVMNGFGRSLIPALESISGSSDTVSMFVYASLLAPIGEELLFRGYILRSLRPYGKRFAIFGSALLFGLFHGNLLQAPYAFLVGLVLGYVTVEYSIHWAVAIHMFNNLVLADLLARLTAGLSDVVLGVLNLCFFGGFLLVSIGILVAKRREVQEYHRSEWMDRRVLKCFFTSPGIVVLTVVMAVNMFLMFFI